MSTWHKGNADPATLKTALFTNIKKCSHGSIAYIELFDCLKTKNYYRNNKKMFHFNLLPYMLTENVI